MRSICLTKKGMLVLREEWVRGLYIAPFERHSLDPHGEKAQHARNDGYLRVKIWLPREVILLNGSLVRTDQQTM